MFLRDDNPAGTSEDELLARDKLAHGLMYLSRGNPVVYFGDEQGYTGAGNDQAARQDLFKSVDLEYDNQGDDAGFNDNIGSPYTPVDSYNAEGNFWTGHPLYREIAAAGAPRQGPSGAARRRPAAPLRGRRPRASTPSAASAPPTSASTSSRSTTPRRPRRRRSRPG